LDAQLAQNTPAGVIRIRGLLADERLHVFVRQQQMALDVPHPHRLEHARVARRKGPFHGRGFFMGLCMRKLQMGFIEWVHGLSANNRKINDFKILLLILSIAISNNEINKQYYFNAKVFFCG
jgi:hypothetical protein